jgi:hypothetical protein
MGSFDLWRGNLGEMRADSPMKPAADTGKARDIERFLQTLAVSRSFDYLPPKCEAAIRHYYVEDRDAEHLPNELETTPAEKLVENCARRLFAIASNIYRELSELSDETPPHRAERDTHPAHSSVGPS